MVAITSITTAACLALLVQATSAVKEQMKGADEKSQHQAAAQSAKRFSSVASWLPEFMKPENEKRYSAAASFLPDMDKRYSAAASFLPDVGYRRKRYSAAASFLPDMRKRYSAAAAFLPEMKRYSAAASFLPDMDKRYSAAASFLPDMGAKKSVAEVSGEMDKREKSPFLFNLESQLGALQRPRTSQTLDASDEEIEKLLKLRI